MYSKHNDKQMGNDQSFCSYCGNNSKMLLNEQHMKDQIYYKKKINKKIIIGVAIAFILVILGIIIF